jgi:hypothetical protein
MLSRVVLIQRVVKGGQGMTDYVTVTVIIDELNPGIWVVGLTGDIAERESEAMLGGRVEFDLARDVFEAGGMEQFMVLVQEIESVEEEVVVTAPARRSLDQNAAGIVGVDPHTTECPSHQGAAVSERRTGNLATELRDDLAQLGGVDVLRRPFPFRVLLGQDLFGGAICVHVQAEKHTLSQTAGTVPNWGSAGEPVCQEMLNDLLITEMTTISGPGRWAMTSTGDNRSRESKSKQLAIVFHPGEGRLATGSRVKESELVVRGPPAFGQPSLGHHDRCQARMSC